MSRKRTWYYDRFEIDMPIECVRDCSHQGECDMDVEHWEDKVDRPLSCTPENLMLELKEYGAWDENELSDDTANWRRIIWITAGNLMDEIRENRRR